MNAQSLRTFVTVVRLGSFSGAAAHLGYTQSAISQQIAALESDLGAVLLHRRPVRPTEAGERLLEHAGPILLRMDAARGELARLTGGPVGRRLTVGGSAPALQHGVAGALARVRRRDPRVEVSVRVLGRAEVAAAVAEGAVDLGLVDGVAAPTNPLRLPADLPVVATAVAEEPLAVVLPADHPLGVRPALDLADLADARWVDAPEAAAPLADLRAAVGWDAFPAGPRYDGPDAGTLLDLVAAEHGLALLPAAVAADRADVAAVPLRAPRLVHRTEALHGRLPSPVATAFLDALEEGGLSRRRAPR
ncbi:LysR family transcriptional regulator [Allostreptomyces psammosilenae]|uniref:DNA-binding transcriptional LysR family regulator n=1 Tax=Allostreptomyces psammosilenae TaxID=1892865 RepID=A0A853A2X2_9ACTN|nr:LysR family transcriptional regulator [Allostreptomyces psammosilenae]NYI04818.1 DNA-binding transcriptional LysR family regulator [Allostreptomyces psammosilenae]